MRHGKLPERDMWTTAGIWIVGLTAAAMSWTGWFLLAVMCGWPPLLAAFLPLAVDVYVVTSARVWLRLPWVSDTTRRFAAFSTFFALAASIAANAAYHLMESLGWHRAPWGAVVAVSGLAPLMLALVAHLQARLNADRAACDTAPAEPAAAAADVVPAAAVPAAVPAEVVPAASQIALAPAASTTPDTTPTATEVATPDTTPDDTTPDTTEPATQPATPEATPARRKTTAAGDNKMRAKAAALIAANPGIRTTELATKFGVTPRTALRWKKDHARLHLVREEA